MTATEESSNRRGHLVLLMAPSGSGKSILLAHLKAALPQLHFAVSCTTRPRRPGEREGETYYFVTDGEFDERMQQGDFLEWAEYSGHRYGTLRAEILEPLERGEVVVREVELQGIRSILAQLPREDVTVVYIDAGDWAMLKGRIMARAPISETELALRYERFVAETAAKSVADKVVKNEEGKIDEAKEALVAILRNVVDNTKNESQNHHIHRPAGKR